MTKTWLVSLLLVAGACGGNPKIGACDFKNVAGKCTVSEVPSDMEMTTLISFAPTSGSTGEGFSGTLEDASGAAASQACSAAAGFTAGTVRTCTLHLSDSCGPSFDIEGYDPATIPACAAE